MSRGSGIWIGMNEEGNDQKSWQGKQKQSKAKQEKQWKESRPSKKTPKSSKRQVRKFSSNITAD